MHALALLLALVLLLPARSAPTPDPTAQRAQLRQEMLPALVARQLSAQERVNAARRFFTGAVPWQAAFPTLQDAPLYDPAFLALEIARLQRAALHPARCATAAVTLPCIKAALDCRKMR